MFLSASAAVGVCKLESSFLGLSWKYGLSSYTQSSVANPNKAEFVAIVSVTSSPVLNLPSAPSFVIDTPWSKELWIVYVGESNVSESSTLRVSGVNSKVGLLNFLTVLTVVELPTA